MFATNSTPAMTFLCLKVHLLMCNVQSSGTYGLVLNSCAKEGHGNLLEYVTFKCVWNCKNLGNTGVISNIDSGQTIFIALVSAQCYH